jgi:hypothetical protein
MNTCLAMLSLLAALVVPKEEVVDVFPDKGSTYVRAGTNRHLKVGAEVKMLADDAGSQVVGKGTVMEVWEKMARVSLDETAQKANPKFAWIAHSAPAHSAAHKGASAPTGPELKGHSERATMGSRIVVFNDGETLWTQCELRLPDESHYTLEHLAPHVSEGIIAIKFMKDSEPTPVIDRVQVKCDEGTSTFEFANPSSGGQLKGFVERAGMGRIVIHNEGTANWSRCDAKLPDGTHYVVGTLTAKDHLRVAQSDFKKEPTASVPNDHLMVQCKEGHARFDLK